MKPTDLRGILQYIPRFREKTFILAVDGAIVTDENFANILLDVAVLRSLNIRVVLVHGASAQIERLGEEQGIVPSDLDGTGVTDAATLKLALTAANRLTHEILEGLSANDLRAATTNAVIAHPVGIIQGVDLEFTGKVERVDVELLQTLLAQGIVPVIPPLGFDGDGKTYRVNSDSAAVAVADALKAVKLIYITSQDGLIVNGELLRQMIVGDLDALLQKNRGDFPPESVSKAQQAAAACRAGVQRVHVINGRVDEGLLAEVFSNEGIGTLIYANEYQQIRAAKKKDVRAIQVLTRKGVRGRGTACSAAAPASRRRSATTTSSRSTRIPWPASRCTSIPTDRRANSPISTSATLAREPGHRPQADSVRREPGPRARPGAGVRALDAGLHLLPVQGRLQRGHAGRSAARPPREIRAKRPPLEGAGEEPQVKHGWRTPERHGCGTHAVLRSCRNPRWLSGSPCCLSDRSGRCERRCWHPCRAGRAACAAVPWIAA